MLEIPDEKAQKALKGVMMELEDCAFPLLQGMVAAAEPEVAFRDVDIALLVGARPRGPGMERKDLLEANGRILDRKSTRLNSSHRCISYAVFCLKKKKKNHVRRSHARAKEDRLIGLMLAWYDR